MYGKRMITNVEEIRVSTLTITDEEGLREKLIDRLSGRFYCSISDYSAYSTEGLLEEWFHFPAFIEEDALEFESLEFDIGYESKNWKILIGFVEGYVEWYGGSSEALFRDVYNGDTMEHVVPKIIWEK